MKLYTFPLLAFSWLLIAGCSSRPPQQVAGSDWLSEEMGGTMHDVLLYPLSERELVYFEQALPALASAAAQHPELWQMISSVEDPKEAAGENAVWREANLSGEDVIAVSLKLTFLREFASAEKGMEADMRANLAWLERRLEGGPAKPELLEAADTIRALLRVIEAHRESGAFAYYAENKERLEAALDRFLSIGEDY